MKNAIAIAGIHTNIGKTIVSAVIAEAIDAQYWKPVQAGENERDSLLLRQLLTGGDTRVHNEALVLSQPLSPHTAAEIDGVTVDYKNFTWPLTDKLLLVETAGGLLSPMSADSTMADFITYYNLPVILVTLNYLGSINHTLLTIEVLKSRGIKVLGLVINGLENESSEQFILSYSGIPLIGRIPFIKELSNESIRKYAMQLRPLLLPIVSSI